MKLTAKWVVLFASLMIFACVKHKTTKEDEDLSNNMKHNKADEVLRNNDEKLIRLNLELYPDTLSDGIKAYVDSVLNSKVKLKSIEMDSDTSYRFVDQNFKYLTEFGWKIFLINGEFLPSQSEFSIYGAYMNLDTVCYGYTSSMMDIYTQIKYCEVSHHHIIIYGINPSFDEDLDTTNMEILAAFHPEVEILH